MRITLGIFIFIATWGYPLIASAGPNDDPKDGVTLGGSVGQVGTEVTYGGSLGLQGDLGSVKIDGGVGSDQTRVLNVKLRLNAKDTESGMLFFDVESNRVTSGNPDLEHQFMVSKIGLRTGDTPSKYIQNDQPNYAEFSVIPTGVIQVGDGQMQGISGIELEAMLKAWKKIPVLVSLMVGKTYGNGSSDIVSITKLGAEIPVTDEITFTPSADMKFFGNGEVVPGFMGTLSVNLNKIAKGD